LNGVVSITKIIKLRKKMHKVLLIAALIFTLLGADNMMPKKASSDTWENKEKNNIVFIGDSLTDFFRSDAEDEHSHDSYVQYLVESMGKNKSIELGYIPFEPFYLQKGTKRGEKYNESLKYSSRMQRMWRYSKNNFANYTYAYSPDGNGMYTNNGKDDYLKINFSSKNKKRFNAVRIYYLKQPHGGTFKVHFKATHPITVPTNSGSSSRFLAWVDISTYGQNIDNISVQITNINGKVALYGLRGINFSPSKNSFSYDIFAKSGATLRDFTRLSKLATYRYFLDGQYDIAIINLGTNDINYEDGGISPEEYKRRLLVYTNRIKQVSPSTKIVLMEPITPVNYNTVKLKQDYTDVRKELCRGHGWGYIDIPSELGGYNESIMRSDGIHPNKEGKQAIARVVRKYLDGDIEE